MYRYVIAVCLLICVPWAGAEIRVHDARGVELLLKKPAKRIISLAPHITELVYAAGAGKYLVGAVSYSDYPAEALEVPRVGSYDGVSYETVLSFRPDLVLAWLGGNGAEAIARMEELGLNVFVLEPRTLEDVSTSLRKVGALSGTDLEAAKAAEEFEHELARLSSTYSGQRSLSVYYQIWNEPLLTLNGDHLISDVVRLCGGRNVFENAPTLVSRVSIESVVRADPDVIIASGMDKARPEWLDDWREWVSMKAVKNGNLYFIPPDILQRNTPRILEGANMLCEQLAQTRASISPDEDNAR